MKNDEPMAKNARLEALEDAFAELLVLLAAEDPDRRPRFFAMFKKIEEDFEELEKTEAAAATKTLFEAFRRA
ncbi:hypothetical protein [Pontitalea aquivivens]|uniref:hypothetical protein n=1 Tax=Pontitalea aquivivens TaxID=3388663 RepID=UPI0039706D1D